MEDAKLIDKELSKLYGKAIDGNQKFRLVWSDGLTEVRKGLFNIFTESGIWLRQEVKTKEVPKYSYIKERYILEAYDPQVKDSEELIVADGYEPIYVFHDKDGNYLRPRLDVCQKIITAWLRAKNGYVYQGNDEIARKKWEAAGDKEEQEIFDQLDQDGTDGKFSSGEAVLIHREGE